MGISQGVYSADQFPIPEKNSMTILARSGASGGAAVYQVRA
jgi:hypothetical protein